MMERNVDEIVALSEAQSARAEFERLEAAFASVRQGMFEIIAASGLNEGGLREQMYTGVQVLDRVKAAMIAAASEADVLEHKGLIERILRGQDAG